MSRPPSPLTSDVVADAILEFLDAVDAVPTEADIAEGLMTSRRTIDRILERDAQCAWSAFLARQLPFARITRTDDDELAQGGDMVEVVALVHGPVAGLLQQRARQARTSVAVVAGQVLTGLVTGGSDPR